MQNMQIGPKLTLEDKLLLLADVDLILGLTQERILRVVQGSKNFTFVSGANTPCGKSVTHISEIGRKRVDIILQSQELETCILELLATGRHNLTTIKRYVGRHYAEKHVFSVLNRMITGGTIVCDNGFYTKKET